MLGTITRFSKMTTSGAIRSEAGVNFDFDLAGVLTYDVAALAEGKFVHFQPAGRSPCKAINVSLEPTAAVHPGVDRNKEITQLRYIGFRHLENLRHFRFERISPGRAHPMLRGGGEPGLVPHVPDRHSGRARAVHARDRRRIGVRP